MREPVVPQFDAETYLMWESRQRDRFELHHGFVVALAGGTIDHDRVAHNLRNAFDRLYPQPCRRFGSDVKIRSTRGRSFTRMRVFISSEVSGSETSFEAPRVVAEVLSPSTRSYDLIEKRAAYRSVPSLHAYVVIHTEFRRLEVDLRDADGAWRTSFTDAEPLPLGGGVLTLDELYARTSLVE
jgi:Uma2 family endonuclease